ncbi:hypothetical protein N7492_001071 [Penicillium capsulatum]|uniref:Uncharacterized protein n=1 Tax=Penicillium capsulatum TaxID=69766 RepID=A0A9W9IRP5_9EURO|nr:hypothetical protein N7492_001071 [Penicillium capsulatum]KAJ6129871.1 hypothetical protein N7512_002651 [Penicillium capsulatum]
MTQLDSNGLALTMRKVDYFLQQANLRVFPEPQATGRNTALWLNAGRLDDNETGTSLSNRAVVRRVPGGDVPITGTVLARGSQTEAAVKGCSADSEWAEEFWK